MGCFSEGLPASQEEREHSVACVHHRHGTPHGRGGRGEGRWEERGEMVPRAGEIVNGREGI